MVDTEDFQRRIAEGRLDESVQRLLKEMGLSSPTMQETPIDIAAATSSVLSRARLLGRSTLCTLNDPDTEPPNQIAARLAAGVEGVLPVLLIRNGTTAAQDATLEITPWGEAVLRTSVLENCLPLDLVAVAQQVNRQVFRGNVPLVDSSVLPLPRSKDSQQAPEATWLLAMSRAERKAFRARPTFQVIYNAPARDLVIVTPLQADDSEQLLAMVTCSGRSPEAVILNRVLGVVPELIGRLHLPDEIVAAPVTSVAVVAETIDPGELPALTPQLVSLYLSTQPMISLPLEQADGGYRLSPDSNDREFLRRWPTAAIAIRIAPRETEVAP